MTWKPQVTTYDNTIYEGDYSYYFEDDVLDDYEWKPYHPTNQQVNDYVDVLTAPFNHTSDNSTKAVKSEPTIVPYPFLEEYAFYDDMSKTVGESKNDTGVEPINECPKPHCKCVCDPL